MTLDTLTALCKTYAEADQALRELVTIFDHDLQELKQEHERPIATALRKARRAQASLVLAVEEGADLFVQPKTRVLEGIKVGLRKLPDAIAALDEAITITLIRKHLPEPLVDVLIAQEESLVKAALKQLDDAQLAQIGAERTAGAQAVVCDPVDGDVDKLIKQLMSQAKSLILAEVA